MSFPLKELANNKEINGTFKLQPQSCLTNPAQAIAMGENSQSSIEEVISIDEGAIGADQSSSYSTIPLSRKAIHQRDADENLFLRFLELDPPPGTVPGPGGTTIPAGAGLTAPVTPKTDEQRKQNKSTYRPLNGGRTPFTITKKLIRINERSYGFSIVWTHPPRVEKVEPGMPADRAGVLPGDFVIFVDKHNVVTMPEIDILNLIRSQCGTLLIEIFRRSNVKPSNGLKCRQPSLTISNNQMMVEQATSKQHSLQHSLQQQQQQQAAILEPRPSTACSNVSYSIETTKRRLNLPQVTFSKEVGSGVIV